MGTGALLWGTYRGAGLLARVRAAVRVSMLPVEEIAAALPETGRVVDAGCGDGALAVWLAGARPRLTVVGMDRDGSRLAAGRAAVPPEPGRVEFVEADLLNGFPGRVNGVIFSDVLHHLERAHQERVLAAAARALEPGGVLVVKEIARDHGWRFRVSALADRVLYPRETCHFRSRAEWLALLGGGGLGLAASQVPVRSWFPGSTNLFLGRKNMGAFPG